MASKNESGCGRGGRQSQNDDKEAWCLLFNLCLLGKDRATRRGKAQNLVCVAAAMRLCPSSRSMLPRGRDGVCRWHLCQVSCNAPWRAVVRQSTECPLLCTAAARLAWDGLFLLHRRWLCWEGTLSPPAAFPRAKELNLSLMMPTPLPPHPSHDCWTSHPSH